jgi:hypothetical protein
MFLQQSLHRKFYSKFLNFSSLYGLSPWLIDPAKTQHTVLWLYGLSMAVVGWSYGLSMAALLLNSTALFWLSG